jgi:hypothetical protein
MPVQRPIVVNTTTGEFERLAATDYLDERDIFQATNGSAGPVVICTPVYLTAVANEIAKAKADAMGTAVVAGLVLDASILAAASGSVLSDGRLTATTAQWDTVTGQTGGLTPGARYFLSATTAGMLSTTPPVADGHVIAPLGVAKSTTEFEITIGTRVKL